MTNDAKKKANWMMQEFARERRAKKNIIKPTPYSDGEDVTTFLHSFEQTMKLQTVEEEGWNAQLAGVLGGQAREACKDVDLSETPYSEIKEIMLRYFSVTSDSQRTKFRDLKWDEKSTLEGFHQRKRTLMMGMAGKEKTRRSAGNSLNGRIRC